MRMIKFQESGWPNSLLTLRLRLYNNQELDENIETIFIPANKAHLFISSSLVKEIIINRGNLAPFLPNQIIKKLY